MAATNTTTAKKATTTTVAKKPATSAASTPAATTRTTTTSTAASNVSTSTATAATNMQSKSAATPTQTPNAGLLPQLSLASFLGLPATIDYQDIAIRVSLVLTGIILLVLVAWAFVRGKQSTQVNVQAPSAHPAGEHTSEAMEAAEVA